MADIACTYRDCPSGVMQWVNGVTFECDTCGRTWAPCWFDVDQVDAAVGRLEERFGTSVDHVLDVALGEQRIVGNPDDYPDAGDLPQLLGIPYMPTAVIVAWAAWARDRDRVDERVA